MEITKLVKVLYSKETVKNLPKTTAWRAKKRGYYFKKVTVVLPKNIDYPEKFESPIIINEAKRIVKKLFHFIPDFDVHYKDMVGEVLLNWCININKSTDFKYRYVIAKQACYTYLNNWKKGGTNWVCPIPTLKDYAEASPENKELWQTLDNNLSNKEKEKLEKYLSEQVLDLPKGIKNKIISILGGKDEK